MNIRFSVGVRSSMAAAIFIIVLADSSCSMNEDTKKKLAIFLKDRPICKREAGECSESKKREKKCPEDAKKFISLVMGSIAGDVNTKYEEKINDYYMKNYDGPDDVNIFLGCYNKADKKRKGNSESEKNHRKNKKIKIAEDARELENLEEKNKYLKKQEVFLEKQIKDLKEQLEAKDRELPKPLESNIYRNDESEKNPMCSDTQYESHIDIETNSCNDVAPVSCAGVESVGCTDIGYAGYQNPDEFSFKVLESNHEYKLLLTSDEYIVKRYNIANNIQDNNPLIFSINPEYVINIKGQLPDVLSKPFKHLSNTHLKMAKYSNQGLISLLYLAYQSWNTS